MFRGERMQRSDFRKNWLGSIKCNEFYILNTRVTILWRSFATNSPSGVLASGATSITVFYDVSYSGVNHASEITICCSGEFLIIILISFG